MPFLSNGLRYKAFGEDATEEELSMFVVWPRYTGRDKGAMMAENENRGPREATHVGILLFETEEDAWSYATRIATFPSEVKRNNLVVTLKEYRQS